MTPAQQSALAALAAASQTMTATAAAVAEAERVLRASLTPTPEPPPPPLPPPSPPTPPASGLQSRAINMAAVVQIGHLSGDRYRRHQNPFIVSGTEASIPVAVNSMAAGGVFVAMNGDFTLTIDGQDAQTIKATGAKRLDFKVPLSDLSEGWHWLDVRCSFQAMPTPMYVRKGQRAVPHSLIPIVTHEYHLVFPLGGASPRVHWGVVPFGSPTPRPIAMAKPEPFSTALRRSDLVCEMLVPSMGADVHLPTITDDGVVTTAGCQSYHWHHLFARLPALPVLDGPRGVGTVSMPTHLQWGRNDKMYFCDPWRVGKISADGAITTLAGYRSSKPPSHYESKAPTLDLVGDWSAIPVERRGFHELWGLSWDERTLAVNESAEPIPAEGNEKPHIVGPVAFVTDSQNGRVCKLQWLPDKHGAAAVTEFITGLRDPWDNVCRNGVLYVSERQSHRICAYDATTGALIRILLQGQDLTGIDKNRVPFNRPGVTLDALRAQPCVLPEGLYLLDEWLYFGSSAQKQVRRLNLDTGELQVVTPFVPTDNGSLFMKIAVSDGTFGPRGSIFTVTWSANGYGFPHAFRPDGSQWLYFDGSSPKGGPWPTPGYPTAVAVGGGRMVCGGVQVALNVIRKALPSDPPAPSVPILNAARQQWYMRGYHLLHGPSGYGHFGFALPWGETPEIDQFLTHCGHAKTSQ